MHIDRRKSREWQRNLLTYSLCTHISFFLFCLFSVVKVYHNLQQKVIFIQLSCWTDMSVWWKWLSMTIPTCQYGECLFYCFINKKIYIIKKSIVSYLDFAIFCARFCWLQQDSWINMTFCCRLWYTFTTLNRQKRKTRYECTRSR